MGGSDEDKFDHPTQKPIELVRRPNPEPSSTSRVGFRSVLGLRATLAAAELTNRVCYGIELDPKYVDVIVQRWQALSGEKARLEGMAARSMT